MKAKGLVWPGTRNFYDTVSFFGEPEGNVYEVTTQRNQEPEIQG
jgi:hypothetical protein